MQAVSSVPLSKVRSDALRPGKGEEQTDAPRRCFFRSLRIRSVSPSPQSSASSASRTSSAVTVLTPRSSADSCALRLHQ